ncbi:MAG: hypothetical protein ACM30E_13390, partial [Nitrososphaerales archaeon]
MRTPAFRIDAPVHDLLTSSRRAEGPPPGESTFPVPVFPRRPERLADPGPSVPPERRSHDSRWVFRLMRSWLKPYVQSRLLPGDFHPITAYLFLEYKCNLDCWYCWSFNNTVKGMSEDIARRSVDWLHERGCRTLALIGGEPLLRPALAHKV